jgi:predicted nucleic acid-binding protein
MIVVADASPLNYLIQVQADELLQKIFGRVLVPPAVMQELRHPRAPESVAAWMLRIPSWIEVRAVTTSKDENLQVLGPGESEAILLAQETHANLLLIDERRGRLEARRRGITTTGTLGVLLAAGWRGFANPESLFQRLTSETSFRSTADVREIFLAACIKINRKHS